ncbi:MAG: MinD/ParA family protein [Acidobacteria bacterium]|nr:MinD/ParA family protein [Acidobacteriota bacterium]
MSDQASTLRTLAAGSKYAGAHEPDPFFQNVSVLFEAGKGPRMLAVTSGKGGVGKTSVATNLAIMLASLEQRVIVLDADAGLANIDVMLGLTPKYHVGHLLNGLKSLAEIMIEGPEGIRIIPASSGNQKLTELTGEQRDHILESVRRLRDEADYILVDTAAGLSDNVVHFLSAAHEVVVVCEPEPTAIVDAYAVIKVVHAMDAQKPIGILVNSVESGDEALRVYDQLDRVAMRFIQRTVDLLGYIYRDPAVPLSVRSQTAVVMGYPDAPASRCFRRLAENMLDREKRNVHARKAPLKLCH